VLCGFPKEALFMRLGLIIPQPVYNAAAATGV